MIIFGGRLFGKVDEVPGVAHVATKFFHVNFIPLLPLSSWVVLHGSQKSGLLGSSWRGFELSGIRWGSALMGWLRCGLVIGCAALALVGLASMGESRWQGAAALLLAAAAGGALWYSYRLTRATAESLRSLSQDANCPADFIQHARAALARDRSGLAR